MLIADTSAGMEALTEVPTAVATDMDLPLPPPRPTAAAATAVKPHVTPHQAMPATQSSARPSHASAPDADSPGHDSPGADSPGHDPPVMSHLMLTHPMLTHLSQSSMMALWLLFGLRTTFLHLLLTADPHHQQTAKQQTPLSRQKHCMQRDPLLSRQKHCKLCNRKRSA